MDGKRKTTESRAGEGGGTVGRAARRDGQARRQRIVIVGGGFGGLYAARALRRAPVEVTLIDKRNFHLFQPLLYQVATGALSPANIAAPLRALLRKQRNARVLLGEVTGIDPRRRRLELADGELVYDTLILAAGATDQYFGHDQWRQVAPGLKSIEDATRIRRRVLLAFERAERAASPEEARALLTFAVVGGGPTGVELAGAIAEIARRTLRREFKQVDPADARVLLIEGGERLLASFPPALSSHAQQVLERLGVEVRLNSLLVEAGSQAIELERDRRRERLACGTTIWAAGVQPSPLARKLAERTGCALDERGRVVVEPDLSVPGYPEIFVIGDMARGLGRNGRPLPWIAPVPMQQATYLGRLLRARLAGRKIGPFRYRHWGMMATIGRSAAVADLGRVRLSGLLGWLSWLFVHLMYLVQFENKLLVLVQWAWNYLTWNRSARLITNPAAPREAAKVNETESQNGSALSGVTSSINR